MVFKTQPYAHQLEALNRFSHYTYWALLSEMGTGKTWILINDYALGVAEGRVQNLLVIAPNGVQWNWVNRELPTHLPEFGAVWAGYAGNMRAKEKQALKALLANKAAVPSVLATSWNSLSNAKGRDVINEFLSGGVPTMVVLDESDYCKNPSTAYAKEVLKISKLAAYRRIATGTPVTNSPYDAWVQFNFLSPTILNCPSYYAFKQRHGVFLPSSHPLVRSIATRRGCPQIPAKDGAGRPIYKDLDRLTAAIAPYSYRVTKDSCLDLPPKTYSVEYVELTPTQRTYYTAVKEAALAVIGDTLTPLPNALAALSAAAQATGNHATSGEVIDPKHNPKLERLLELVNGVSGQVIVWCRYTAEIRDILAAAQAAGLTAVSYYGENTPAQREAALEAWRGGAKLLVANAKAGGTGLTLNEAGYVVYYSNSFSLHDRLQSEDRCHRIGQAKNVQYIDLVARGTIDEDIVAALVAKEDVAARVIGALRR